MKWTWRKRVGRAVSVVALSTPGSTQILPPAIAIKKTAVSSSQPRYRHSTERKKKFIQHQSQRILSNRRTGGVQPLLEVLSLSLSFLSIVCSEQFPRIAGCRGGGQICGRVRSYQYNRQSTLSVLPSSESSMQSITYPLRK